MRWEPAACQAGDMVRIRLGSVYHYGVFVSEDEVIQFGLPPTAENRAAEGEVKVLATDVDVFACGCIVETAQLDRAEQKRRVPPEETVRRARSRIGEGGYNILHNNCEHFVNECVFGESRCSQEEDVRRRWLNRPICDVYLMAVPAKTDAADIYPDKRRAEIAKIKDEAERNAAVCLWQLLDVAANHSFRTSLRDAGLKRKLGGRWVCSGFSFALACQSGIAAVAVSNAPVEIQLGGSGQTRTLKQPPLAIHVSGAHSAAAKYFWAENGAVTLMGGSYFA